MFSIYSRPKCLLYAVNEEKLFGGKKNKNNWTSATEPAGTQNISMKGNPTGPAICRVTILSVRRKSEPSAEARLISSLSTACPIPALSGSRVHKVPRNGHTIPPPAGKLFILTAAESFHCVSGLNSWLCTQERYSCSFTGSCGSSRGGVRKEHGAPALCPPPLASANLT